MQGYKDKEKTAIVPHCTPSFKTQWAPCHYYKYNFWQQGRFHITLVLYIGSLPHLTTWFHCGRGRTLFILGLLGQRSRSLLLWIEILTLPAHMISCLTELPLYRLIIYIDRHILWCTHFLLMLIWNTRCLPLQDTF